MFPKLPTRSTFLQVFWWLIRNTNLKLLFIIYLFILFVLIVCIKYLKVGKLHILSSFGRVPQEILVCPHRNHSSFVFSGSLMDLDVDSATDDSEAYFWIRLDFTILILHENSGFDLKKSLHFEAKHIRWIIFFWLIRSL